MRINRYLASAGLCSRRKAETYINEGLVTINGTVAKLGDRVEEGDRVELEGKLIEPETRNVTLAYHKPVGVECTADPSTENNIISVLEYPLRLFTVGRLDKDSEGLILLTNDGDFCYKLSKASEEHEKEYLVTLNKPYSAGFLRRMASGVEILDTVTAPCKVERVSERSFKIVLVQGLNRQIRRMCEALGYRVTSLIRLRIDKLTLDGIPKGEYRELNPEEMKLFFHL